MTPTPKPRAVRVLLPLVALFFLPIAGAIALYFYFPQWIPDSKTNYGELVAPARPAPAFAESLKGRWTYVYLVDDGCATDCLAKLAQIRQIRLALNEKRERVQRVVLAPTDSVAAALAEALKLDHPDLKVLADRDNAARGFFAATHSDAVYLLDPNGNWLMTYPPAAESRGIYKDIKRLLKLSQIG